MGTANGNRTQNSKAGIPYSMRNRHGSSDRCVRTRFGVITFIDVYDDDVVRCFIKATLKHSKAPGVYYRRGRRPREDEQEEDKG